jgi:hypothetical protein
VDPPATPTTNNGGWRRASDPPAAPAQDPSVTDPSAQDQTAPVVQDPQPASRDAYGQPSANRPPAAQPPRPAYGLPAQVTLKPGTFVSMRITQGLASNKNAAGDTFSGALTQPVVVDGIVVAQRGQMVYGRVAEADKVKGMHRLGIELTGLTLADGTQAAVHSQLMSRQGPMMPYGRHEDGVITTATADGTPAGAAGTATIGVLATKGHASVIYPETMLTFQTENAVTINTGNSSGAYRYVGPDDYARPSTMSQTVATRPAYVYGPGYYGYPYPYYGWGYPYWGPGIGIGFGFGGYYGFRGGFRR